MTEMILPQEIMFYEILCRVPAMSLLRFKCVCKLWCSKISDPYFVRAHLNHWRRGSSLAHLSQDFPAIMKFVFSDPQNSERFEVSITDWLKSKILDPFNSYPIASCDGLFLIEIYPYPSIAFCERLFIEMIKYERKYCVGNPITRKSVMLPTPSHFLSLPTSSRFFTRCELVYDARKSLQYKVLAFIENEFLVFTLGHDTSWRVLARPEGCCCLGQRPILIKGVLHWAASRRRTNTTHEGNIESCIMSMDIATELVWEIRLPSQEENLLLWVDLVELKGSLYLKRASEDHESLTIWVLQYSEENPQVWNWIKLACLHVNGSVIKKFVPCDTNMLEEVHTGDSEGKGHDFFPSRMGCGVPHVNSLVDWESQ